MVSGEARDPERLAAKDEDWPDVEPVYWARAWPSSDGFTLHRIYPL
jgi:hypothetical protein